MNPFLFRTISRRCAAWRWGVTALLAAFLLLPAAVRAQVQARRADDFINSIGICTHWSYGDTPYGYAFPQVFQKLQDSGIRHVRDGGRLAELTGVGIGSTFYADVPNNSNGDDNTIRQLVADLKSKLAAGYKIDAIEGPNEPDLFWDGNRSYKGQGYQQGQQGIINGVVAFMQDLYTAMKADPATRNLPIYGPSVTRIKGVPLPANSLTNYVDYGNFHPYCGGNPFSDTNSYAGLDRYWWYATNPVNNIDDQWPTQINQGQPPFGTKQMVATETGYSTWSGGTWSEAVHAKYMPRLFLEYFRRGVARTYSYEFVDEFDNPNNDDRESHFGLLRRDLSPKPAYTALQSLIRLLSDPGGNGFAPASLNYSVQVAPPAGYTRTQYVRHQLFQKQNGRFYLVIYHEISGEDGHVTPHTLLTHPAMPTTITLPASIGSATVYAYDQNFALQAAPAAIANNRLTLNITDQVTVLELQTGAAAPVLADGVYTLTSQVSVGGTPLRRLDVDGAVDADGNKVQLWEQNTSSAQRWRFEHVGNDVYKITAQVGGQTRVLDADNSNGIVDGAQAQIWYDSGTSNQRWKVEATGNGYYKLTVAASLGGATKYCLDVNGRVNANRTKVQLWNDNGTVAQRWLIESATAARAASAPAAAAAATTEPAAPAPLSAYPNPSRGEATLALEAKQAQTVALYVYNEQGHLVSLLTVPARAGHTDFRLPTTLPPGTYRLRATVDGQRQQFTLQVE